MSAAPPGRRKEGGGSEEEESSPETETTMATATTVATEKERRGQSEPEDGKSANEEKEGEEKEGVCAICLQPMTLAKQIILACGHRNFCEECISSWYLQKGPNSRTCPLCKELIGVSSMRRSVDGSLFLVADADGQGASGPGEQHKGKDGAARHEEDASEALACLAHADLVPDISRLLQSARAHSARLEKEQPKTHSKFGGQVWRSSADRSAFDRLQAIIAQLETLLDDFRNLRGLFDPSEMLKRLYAYESEITALSFSRSLASPSLPSSSSSSSSSSSTSFSSSSSAPKRYGADDYDQVENDSYDY